MLRKLGLLGVISLLFGGCDNISNLSLRQRDSGVTEDSGRAGGDSSVPVSGPLVTNPGAACALDSDCKGPAATCQTSLGGGAPGGATIEFPGGYCTATCSTQDECAVGSECGVRKLVDTLEPLLMMSGTTIPPGILDAIPSQCLDLCSTSTACREGYKCQSLIDAAGLANVVPIPTFFLSRYCLPKINLPPPNMDAGSGTDAGSATDAGSVTDGGAHTDAAPPQVDASVRSQDGGS